MLHVLYVCKSVFARMGLNEIMHLNVLISAKLSGFAMAF